MSQLATLVVAVVGVVIAAYLSALDTMLARVNLVRALRLEDEQRGGASSLLWLAEHRATAQDAVLVISQVVRVSLIAAIIAAAASAGNGWRTVGAAAAVTAVIWLFVDIVPRTATLRYLEPVSLALAPSGRLVVIGVRPLATIVVSLGRWLVPNRAAISGPHASDDELRETDNSEDDRDEAIEPEERAMIRSIFELADTRVREIMTPRPDMIMVAAGVPLGELVEIVTERGVSRVPVHDADNPDRIVGIVYAKDLLARVAHGHRAWDDLIRTPTFVPEVKRGDELLRELQESAVHMAIVVDEYGDISGLVTIEDILEEIVGEIVDEHDHEEPLVEFVDDGLVVDGRLGVDDLNELLSADLPEEGWDTVGGLVFGTLGRVPEPGERIEIDGVGLEVVAVQGRRVNKVFVTTAGTESAGSDATAASSGTTATGA